MSNAVEAAALQRQELQRRNMARGFVLDVLVQNLWEVCSERLLLLNHNTYFACVNWCVLTSTSLMNMRTAEPKIQRALENEQQTFCITILL